MLARLAMREMNAALKELRALVEALGEDPDTELDDLLVDDVEPDDDVERAEV
jgi:type I restriction enzyme M protein